MRIRTTVALLLVILPVLVGRSLLAQDDAPSQNEVGRLIEQLGNESYATRTRAQEKLQRMGLEAFDQLHSAQFHPDNEIAMSARFLVSSLLVSWSKESDPAEVQDALTEYGAQTDSERSSRIDLLAEFSDRKGLAALTRLTRFETSLRLSRRAALALMQQPMGNDQNERRRNSDLILKVLGDNDRQGAQWLRVYAEDLASGEYSVQRWSELIDEQREQIDSVSSSETTRPSVLELVRVCATRASRSGHRDEALRIAATNMDLIAPTTRDLIDACSWAIDSDLHPFVLSLREKHRRMFDKQPFLLYGAAEAKHDAGDQAGAEELAKQASQIRPLPQTEAERAKLQPKDIDDTAQAHREIAETLRDRGLFQWAEREFRLIIDSLDVSSRTSATARNDMAMMLAELERHDDVVSVLKPLVDRIENDAKLKQQLNMLTMDTRQVVSNLDYHTGLALIEEGKFEEAQPLFSKAYRTYPRNIDILISMYRVDGDQEWRKEVMTLLERAIRSAESDVQSAKSGIRQPGQRVNPSYLAQEYNQYAWLVCNTEGDYQKALRYSLESLKLELDFAKLDTCARCHYAVGDLEAAVRTQKRALKLMPHSPALQRQLAEFEAKLKESQTKENAE